MSFSPFGGTADLMFSLVPLIVFVGFILVFGLIIIKIIQSGKQWKKNNDSPVLSVEATLVTKRSDVHHYRHHTSDSSAMYSSSSSTTYFATFEVDSGDRMEFKVADSEYGMLVEGDTGKLTFQGTRYLGFERIRK